MKRAIYILLAIISTTSLTKAQTPFREGVVTYQGDTVKRYEKYPAHHTVARLVVYKKQDLIRFEICRVSPVNKDYWQKDIYIRNEVGTYLFHESSDTLMNRVTNFALFVPYEEEKLLRSERLLQGRLVGYKLDKVIQSVRWLGLPAARVTLTGGAMKEPTEAIVTDAVDLPIGAVFEALSTVPGTPLQFIIQEVGWLIRLRATELKAQRLPDALFQIETGRKLISFGQMMEEISSFK